MHVSTKQNKFFILFLFILTLPLLIHAVVVPSHPQKTVLAVVTAPLSPSPSLVPKPSCTQPPPCLTATPRCLPPEPLGGWCPSLTVTPVILTPTGTPAGCYLQTCTTVCPKTNPQCCQQTLVCPTPTITCIPRPACLDATPPCLIANRNYCPKNETTLVFSVLLPEHTAKSNPKPKHPQRNITIQLFSATDQKGFEAKGQAVFDEKTTIFLAHVLLPKTITTGDYIVKITMKSYLRKQLTGVIHITVGQVNQVISPVTLVAGDIDGDNVLDVLDYNILVSCFGERADTASCLLKDQADLNDDGVIDGIDYNIMLRNFLSREGD